MIRLLADADESHTHETALTHCDSFHPCESTVDGLQKLELYRFSADEHDNTFENNKIIRCAKSTTFTSPERNRTTNTSSSPPIAEYNNVENVTPFKRLSTEACPKDSPSQKKHNSNSISTSNQTVKTGSPNNSVTPVRELKQLDVRAFFVNKK